MAMLNYRRVMVSNTSKREDHALMVMMVTAYAYKYSVYIIQLDVFRCTVQHSTKLWKQKHNGYNCVFHRKILDLFVSMCFSPCYPLIIVSLILSAGTRPHNIESILRVIFNPQFTSKL